MYYFVFDLDQTLAELYSMYYFIASLKLSESIIEYNCSLPPIPERMKHQLKYAYSLFLKGILNEEVSERPLGILRPGILDVMVELYLLKVDGILNNVLIYSNNRHLESLEFIRDLIHEHIGHYDLIRECIHWNHPMRDDDRISYQGLYTKTWPVLKNIMIEGHCQAPSSLQASQVHFFDDLEHMQLKSELRENYHMIDPYRFRASFKRISDIYREAIQEAHINMMDYMEYVVPLFATSEDIIPFDNPLESMIELFRNKTGQTANESSIPPFWNTGVNTMIDVIKLIRFTRKQEQEEQQLREEMLRRMDSNESIVGWLEVDAGENIVVDGPVRRIENESDMHESCIYQ